MKQTIMRQGIINQVMMNKVFVLLSVFISAVSISFGQQSAQISQYGINAFLINPAVSASEDFFTVKAAHRTQWVSVPGAPTTTYLNAHSTVGKDHSVMGHKGGNHNWHGVGGLIYQHQVGALRENNVYLNYAYDLKISSGSGFGLHHHDGVRLALGTFLGVKNQRWDRIGLTQKHTLTDNEAAGTVELDVTPSGPSTVLDGSIGGMIYLRDKFYVGFSAFQLFSSKITFTNSRLNKHYFFTASYRFRGGEHHYFIPTLLVKGVQGAPLSTDLGLKYDYDDKLWLGGSLRFGNDLSVQEGSSLGFNTFSVFVGTLIQFQTHEQGHTKIKHRYGLEIYYSYDMTLSALNQFSKGSHEVTLGLRLPPMFKNQNR